MIDFQAMPDALLGLNTVELRELAQAEGERAYRGDQVADWMYRRAARTFDEMTNLPEALRTRLTAKYTIGRSHVTASRRSNDGTVKLLLELHDGARIETVGLPYPERVSCCVSTQVGCPVGCAFCATGLSGYARNLTAGEIIDQVLAVQETLRQDDSVARVDHVTFMGMGEPLLNYDATLKAIQLLNDELGIAMRNLSISTAGLVPGIQRLAREHLQVTLAVSLHAATNELRARLMPGAKRWRVDEVIAACQEYVLETGRRVTVEYCLIGGVNDGAAEAGELARLLRGLNCHVNLIPFNPVAGLLFRKPSRDRVSAFRQRLEDAGIQTTQRLQRGARIDAACGQLRRRLAGPVS